MASKYPDVVFVKVNVDETVCVQHLSNYQYKSIPTFGAYRNGKKVAAFPGAKPDTLEEFITTVMAPSW